MRVPAVQSDRGQATLEYLVVGLALIVFIAGIAALWRYFEGPGPADLASGSVSHSADDVRGLADALLY